MDTSEPDRLTPVEVLLEHQDTLLASVRDRIERVALQQRGIKSQLTWLDARLDHLHRVLNRRPGRP
jgi:hypothetical protein